MGLVQKIALQVFAEGEFLADAVFEVVLAPVGLSSAQLISLKLLFCRLELAVKLVRRIPGKPEITRADTVLAHIAIKGISIVNFFLQWISLELTQADAVLAHGSRARFASPIW